MVMADPTVAETSDSPVNPGAQLDPNASSWAGLIIEPQHEHRASVLIHHSLSCGRSQGAQVVQWCVRYVADVVKQTQS